MKSFWNKLFSKPPKKSPVKTCGTGMTTLKSDTTWRGGRDAEYANKLISLQRKAKQKKVIKRLTSQVEV